MEAVQHDPARAPTVRQPARRPRCRRRHHRHGRRSPSPARPAAAAPDPDSARGGSPNRVPLDRISIQLYTLRDQSQIDLAGTLAALRRIGYTRVEHAGFVGRTAAQFRAALDAAGLRATSGHVGIPQPFDAAAWQRALADAHIVGNRYIVHPFFGLDAERPTDPRRGRLPAFARDLNRAGALAKRAGLELRLPQPPPGVRPAERRRAHRVRHPHRGDRSGPRAPGGRPVLGLARRRRPGRPHPRHRGRIRQVHVKDMDVTREFTSAPFADPGTGLIDFGRIFEHAREAGIAEYIVERDDAGKPAAHTGRRTGHRPGRLRVPRPAALLSGGVSFDANVRPPCSPCSDCWSSPVGVASPAAAAAAAPPAAATPPADSNFQKVTLNDFPGEPMSLAVLPDNRVLHTARTGEVRIHDPRTGLNRPRRRRAGVRARRGGPAGHRDRPRLRPQQAGSTSTTRRR